MRIATLSLAIGLMAFAGTASADITDFHFTPVENGGTPPDHVTTDVSLSGTGLLTGIQMLLELTAGEIFQDDVGGVGAPNDALFDTFPALEFDTFIGLGGTTAATSPDPVRPGGAVNVPGGSSGETFSSSMLDITWAPPGASPVNDPMDYFVSRLTLSNDAQGTVQFLGATEDSSDLFDPLTIENGVVGGDGGGGGDPVAVGDPVDGSEISMQSAFDDGSGLLAEAIMLMNDNPDSDDPLEILNLEVDDENGLYSAVVNSGDPLKIDLMLDVESARQFPRGFLATADLLVETNGGDLNYSLSAVVPEPSTIALAGLGLVGVVGLARRRK